MTGAATAQSNDAGLFGTGRPAPQWFTNLLLIGLTAAITWMLSQNVKTAVQEVQYINLNQKVDDMRKDMREEFARINQKLDQKQDKRSSR